MIEKLLAAFAEGAEDAGGAGGGVLRTGVGVEEIADILWLAARVDPLAAAPEAPITEAPPPAPRPDSDDAEPPRTAADGEPLVRLFPGPGRDHADTGSDSDSGSAAAPAAGVRRGSPLRLPRAVSLDDPLALMRSLRPVGRRSIGGPGEELDEQLTVERSIERMVPTPVLRPAESRWLDLALVVDTHHSMLLWSDLVEELRGVFTRSGVFRDVRTWQLAGTGPGGAPMVARARGGPPRNPLELADPAGRRLILVLSDTVAAGWREAPLQGLLRHWCAHNAVAVLNVLPERLWTRGAVRPVPYAVRADRPAAATRSWQRVPVVRRGRGRGPVVPVVGIASGSLARLVRVVSGDGRWRRLACLRLDAEAAPASTYEKSPGGPGPARALASPLEVVERFRQNASPTAQQLAAHLAAVPLTLPVMTLVRRSLLRDSEHGHLAEVALGGLFAPWGAEQEAQDAEFEFLPGVREALLGSQLRGDVAAVRELVRRRVWEFMARNRTGGRDFSATRVTTGAEGRREVAAGAQPFAVAGGPLADPGLGGRVVRVRFEPVPEPQEVGVLLSPRMVLTVGDARLGRGAVAWVRSGDREIACRSVWWDEAAPRVFLLLAVEDLVDPATWAELRWGAQPDGGEGAAPVRLRVDGSNDQGEPIALTGEMIPSSGERNGELIRLSAEPDAWTHYGGAPVSRDGELIGVVHSVWPDRMVFLTGQALAEQRDFREVMAAHTQAQRETTRTAAGPGACLALHAEVAMGPRGREVTSDLIEQLVRVMADIGMTGRFAAVVETDLLVAVEGPRALGKVARLLAELPDVVARLTAGSAGWVLALGVAVALGEVQTGAEGVSGPAVADARRLVRHPRLGERLRDPAPGESVALVLCEPLDRMGDVLSILMRRLEPREDGPAGWLCLNGVVETARILLDADVIADVDSIDWPHCGQGATEAEPTGCIGIRLPGYPRCLAHASEAEQAEYLAALGGAGALVDLRGTTFDNGLLQRVLDAVVAPATGQVLLADVVFDRAYFADDWITTGAVFEGRASFDRAEFAGRAVFEEAAFHGPASFAWTVFGNGCAFDRSRFEGTAGFRRAAFRGPAGFTGATFRKDLDMNRAVLDSSAALDRMSVLGPADFTHAVFSGLTGMSGVDFAGVSFAFARWERPLVSTGGRFRGTVSFAAAAFVDFLRWRDTTFERRVDFARVAIGGEARFERVDFMDETNFRAAAFNGRALFVNTSFHAEADFRDSVFAGPAEFTEVVTALPFQPPGEWEVLKSRAGTRSLRRSPDPAQPPEA
ncbi:SAV_2336 N-terminal domain-related protein [Streptomyces sp. NPDC060031]|uniref:SAV_2336 N-terminal domain-related protein n=1 Tax=Streptomyces sp. NPDC060031 TaxID=3347043 RepID=UPI00367F28DF